MSGGLTGGGRAEVERHLAHRRAPLKENELHLHQPEVNAAAKQKGDRGEPESEQPARGGRARRPRHFLSADAGGVTVGTVIVGLTAGVAAAEEVAGWRTSCILPTMSFSFWRRASSSSVVVFL